MGTRHLVIGAGGSRAFLTGIGAIVALKLGGLKEWSSIGGVSGGSIPALFMAHGLGLQELVEGLMSLDFRNLMRSCPGGKDAMQDHALDDEGNAPAPNFVARLLARGALHTDMLGQAVESVVNEWPDNFWTMAMSERSHVVFTKVGVFEYGFDGSVRQLTEEPAPVGLAIRATCAIPGLLESVQFKGLSLFDGSLSAYGGCPVGFVRKHFDADEDLVVRCRSIGKGAGRDRFLVKLGQRLLCQGSRRVAVENEEAEVNIEPVMPDLHTFRFKLTVEQKRQGLLAGFNAAVGALMSNKSYFEGRLDSLSHSLDRDRLSRCADFDEFLNRIN
ncbi:MAG: patatin-like phospholipase family protein [Candidatus Obscuribacterales bacterium]|nr:patatin-like phospholipase family protein [Candidatus Obscuribacterales bacterium]